VTATPAERTARLARLGRIGVWLLLAGGLLDVVIVAAWLAAAPPGAGLGGLLAGPLGRPERPFALGLLGGTVVGLAGLGLYVVVPGFDPSLAKRELDRPSAILASLAAVVVLGIVLPLPLIYLTVGPRPPSPLPPASDTPSATSPSTETSTPVSSRRVRRRPPRRAEAYARMPIPPAVML
jgi:hypothetical protein